MFKIAVCDDNLSQCTEIENIIEEYFLSEDMKFELDVFISCEELLESLNSGEKYDLLFLDIQFEGLNGISVGKHIREVLLDDNIQIVYISGDTSYALELFQIRPMHFLIKPLNKQQVINVIGKAIELQGRQTKIFRYKTGKAEKKVPFRDVMYFSSDAKKIVIHMKNTEDVYYGKLTDLIYPIEDFICIHKSFVINRHYVKQFKFDSVLMMNNEELPISRAYRKEVRDKLKEWHREGL